MMRTIFDWVRQRAPFLWVVAAVCSFGQAVGYASSHRTMLVILSGGIAIIAMWNAYYLHETRSLKRIRQLVASIGVVQDAQHAQMKVILECHVDQRHLVELLSRVAEAQAKVDRARSDEAGAS